jgi:methylmalonyl-CoA/ethylmalonyl-CoA epimerase
MTGDTGGNVGEWTGGSARGNTGVPFRKIEHIGIAVRDLDEAAARYERTMGTSCYKRETVESEGVETAFFRVGESKIELLAATRDDSPVARFLEKRGEGMHHMAFEVDDIHAEMERCRSLGYTLLSETPKPGADNKLVAFLHPKEHHGVLIELCQTIT